MWHVRCLTPLLQCREELLGRSEDSLSSTNVMRLSLRRKGGVADRAGDAVGVAIGVGRRLFLKMD